MDTIYESLRKPVDLVKLNTYKDGLEADINAFQAAQENVTDLLIRLELPDKEQLIHDEFLGVNARMFSGHQSKNQRPRNGKS